MSLGLLRSGFDRRLPGSRRRRRLVGQTMSDRRRLCRSLQPAPFSGYGCELVRRGRAASSKTGAETTAPPRPPPRAATGPAERRRPARIDFRRDCSAVPAPSRRGLDRLACVRLGRRLAPRGREHAPPRPPHPFPIGCLSSGCTGPLKKGAPAAWPCDELCTEPPDMERRMTFSQRLAQAAQLVEAHLAGLLERGGRRRGAAAAGGGHAPCDARRRQAAAPVPGARDAPACSAWRRRPRCRPPRRSSACTATRWCTTTSPPWTTTTCAAAGPPCTRLSTSGPRSWRATRC